MKIWRQIQDEDIHGNISRKLLQNEKFCVKKDRGENKIIFEYKNL